MTKITGNRKQEEKISEMGNIAHTLFPDVSTIAFKGVFRYGIEKALDDRHLENWDRVAAENPETRSQFFKSILNNSIQRLGKIGLDNQQIDTLVKKNHQRE